MKVADRCLNSEPQRWLGCSPVALRGRSVVSGKRRAKRSRRALLSCRLKHVHHVPVPTSASSYEVAAQRLRAVLLLDILRQSVLASPLPQLYRDGYQTFLAHKAMESQLYSLDERLAALERECPGGLVSLLDSTQNKHARR